jgi:transposase
MDVLTKLALTDIDPAMLAQVRALFEQQQVKLQCKEALIAAQPFKIAALAHELAYYRRVRFGKASEVLAGEQRMLFDETVAMDLAAIEEELDTEAPDKRQCKRAGRQALLPELPRIDHRHDPDSCHAANAAPT